MSCLGAAEGALASTCASFLYLIGISYKAALIHGLSRSVFSHIELFQPVLSPLRKITIFAFSPASPGNRSPWPAGSWGGVKAPGAV